MSRIAGIDVGGTYIKAGLVLKPPKVEKFKSMATEPARLVEQLVELISEFKPEAAGIGVPGLVANGVLHSSPNLPGIKNLKLEKMLSSRLKLPIRVANDASIVALGEWKYGAGKGTHNLLLLTLGTGVGGGLIIQDKLYLGTGFAGEVGHITIDPNGPPCGCGNYGCLESFVGSGALEYRAKQGIKLGIKTALSRYEKITPEIISKEAYLGDKFAHSIIDTAGYYLGIGIASLCAVLEPDRVVLGGGISKAGEMLFTRVREEVRRRFYASGVPLSSGSRRGGTGHLKKEIPVVPTQLGDHAGILGSALYVSI